MLRTFSVLTLVLTLFAVTGVAAPSVKPEEGVVSAKGKLTQVNLEGKSLLIRIEEGLELTFFADETTRIQIGKETKSLADLAAGDSVEIEYRYDQDYQKVLQSIRKE